ncbi:hypothetical protein JXM67_15130 [candidate division WOR-3 bacterium]|nr:hypothetical protein [candidate division WOR-3 bacterium]
MITQAYLLYVAKAGFFDSIMDGVTPPDRNIGITLDEIEQRYERKPWGDSYEKGNRHPDINVRDMNDYIDTWEPTWEHVEKWHPLWKDTQ